MINPDNLYWFTSSMGRVEFKIPGQCVIDCSHSGDCLPDVEYWEKQINWADIDPDAIREELSEYGAWDQDELQDHDQNLARILWLACGSLQEEINAGEYVS